MKKRLGHCFGESSRKSRVKMHKSGKHWVTTVMSFIGLIRFCKGLVENKLSLLQKEEVETSQLPRHLLKGAAALSAIVAGGVAQSAFAEETVISMDEELSNTNVNLANTEVVTLSDVDEASEAQEESTTQSETEISSASLSESLSQSLSQSESLSTSVSLSESLSEADSQSDVVSESESTESSSEVSLQAVVASSESVVASSEQTIVVTSETALEKTELTTVQENELVVADTLVALDDTEVTYDATYFTYDGNTVSVKPVEEQVASDDLGSTDLKWAADQTEGRVLFGIVELTDKSGTDTDVNTGDFSTTGYISYTIDGVPMVEGISSDDLPIYITVFDADGNQIAQYTLDTAGDSVDIDYNDGASTVTVSRVTNDDGTQSIVAQVIKTSSNVNQIRLLYPYVKDSYVSATMNTATRAIPKVGTRNVHYIYEDTGTYITDIYKQYGMAGDSFTTGAIDVPGYKLDYVVGQESGTINYYATSASDNIGKISQQTVNNGNYIYKWTNIGIDNSGYIRKYELIDAATGEVLDTATLSYNETYILGSSGNSEGSYQLTVTNKANLPNTDTFYYYVKMDDSESESQSTSYSTSSSESLSTSMSDSVSISESASTSTSESLSTSTSESISISESVSSSESESVSASESSSTSESASQSTSISESLSTSTSESISSSESVSSSESESVSSSESSSTSESASVSESTTISESASMSTSESTSLSISHSISLSESSSISESVSVSQSLSESFSDSSSESIFLSESLSSSESTSELLSLSESESLSNTGSVVVNYITTDGVVLKEQYADTTNADAGTSYNTAENDSEKPSTITVTNDDGTTTTYKLVRVATSLDDEAVVKNGTITRADSEEGSVEASTTKVVTYVYEKVTGDVVVEYYDTKGNVIKEPVVDTPESPVGTDYDTTDNKPSVITTENGKTYYYKKVSDSTDPSGDSATETGSVVEGTTTIKYVYEEAGSVVVNYIAEDGTVLQPQYKDTTDAEAGTSYNTAENDSEKPNYITVTNADGTTTTYELVRVATSLDDEAIQANGTITKVDPETGEVVSGETQVVTYIYKVVPSEEVTGDVVVEYYDTKGNVIKEPVVDTPESPVGTDYDTTDNKPSVITTEDGKTYYYKKVSDSTDPSGGSATETGSVVEGTTTIKYVYEEAGSVVVNYIAEDGTALQPQYKDTTDAEAGTSYNTAENSTEKPSTITVTNADGTTTTYELVRVATSLDDEAIKANGTITKVDPETGEVISGETQVVTYVYKVVPSEEVPKGDVVVNYVDEDGNVIKTPVVDTPESPVGTDYDTTDNKPMTITVTNPDGTTTTYELIPSRTIGDENGTVVEGTTEITYVYKKVSETSAPKGDVIIHYINEKGEVIKETVVDTPESPVGTAYDTTDNKPTVIRVTNPDGSISVYELIPSRTIGDEMGLVVEGTTEITYVYRLKEVIPASNTSSESTATPTQTTHKQEKTVTPTVAKATSLPQTGEDSSTTSTLVGAGLVAASAAILAKGKKKKQN